MTENKGYTRHGPEVDERAERLIGSDVLACQSSLVELLLGSLAFSVDEIEGLYPDPTSWSARECADWLRERGVHPSDDESEQLWDIVRDHAEPAEVFEWWLVTDHLAECLRDQGEPLLVTDYGTWWGRTCSGQSILLDGTMQSIIVKRDEVLAEMLAKPLVTSPRPEL